MNGSNNFVNKHYKLDKKKAANVRNEIENDIGSLMGCI